MVARSQKKQRSMALYEAILKLRDLDECCRFFDDLCTPTELRSMEQRFDVATYLQEDQVYLEILEKAYKAEDLLNGGMRSIVMIKGEPVQLELPPRGAVVYKLK